ncbi:MAG: GMC family oxidoreductase [Thermoanaerobaculia bacterium]|nr:GMC family oxidoreductase [Thermoanaerobaculia bacterium]
MLGREDGVSRSSKVPADYDHRGADVGGKAYFGKGKPFGFFSTTSGGWELGRRTLHRGRGAANFRWFRSRILGGRTNHYGRMSFRFAKYDFTPYDKDGLGFNWPISYEDLSPYYDKAEEFIGVCGTNEGVESCPDGKFQPAPPPRVHETLVKKAMFIADAIAVGRAAQPQWGSRAKPAPATAQSDCRRRRGAP